MSLAKFAHRQPPGPDAPVSLGIDPDTLVTLRQARQNYGNIVAFEKPDGRAALFINEPAEIRNILVRRYAKYRKGPGFERVKMLLGNGLIVSDGDTWRRSRTMIQPAFSRANVHRLIDLMVRCTLLRERRWRDAAAAGEAINISQETSDFALELILRAIFGADYDRHIIAGGKNPFAFLSQDSARDLSVVLKLRELRELLLRIVAERRASARNETYDFLSIYMNTTDKSGNGFSDGELLDELMTLIVAGYETSAGTLNWTWYLLALHPEVHEELVTEARKSMPDSADVSDSAIAEMPCAQAILDETLRLYPPVWLFTRRADEGDVLTGYDVPRGADIYLSPFILHRTDEFWADPERFDPGRFGPDGACKKGDRPYFPFSLGPRRCVGEYFSFLEMKVHLGILAQTFSMTLADESIPALDLGINLRSQSDIFLRPVLRTQP